MWVLVYAHAYSVHIVCVYVVCVCVCVCVYLSISIFSVLSGGYGLGTTPGERTWTENNKKPLAPREGDSGSDNSNHF